MIGDQIDCDDSQRELIMKASEMNDDGRIGEINLLNVLDRWRKYFMREKRKKENHRYMIGSCFGSKDIRLKSFLNVD